MMLFKNTITAALLTSLLSTSLLAAEGDEKTLAPVIEKQSKLIVCERLLSQLLAEKINLSELVRVDAKEEQEILDTLIKEEGFEKSDAERLLILWRNRELLDYGVLHRAIVDEILSIHPGTPAEVRSFLGAFDMLSAQKKEAFLDNVIKRVNTIAGAELGYKELFQLDERAADFNLTPDQFREFIRNWQKLFKEDPNEAKLLVFLNVVGNSKELLKEVGKRSSFRVWVKSKLRRMKAARERKRALKRQSPTKLLTSGENGGNSSPAAAIATETLKSNFRSGLNSAESRISYNYGYSHEFYAEGTRAKIINLMNRNIRAADRAYALWVAHEILDHELMKNKLNSTEQRKVVTSLFKELKGLQFRESDSPVIEEIERLLRWYKERNFLSFSSKSDSSKRAYSKFDKALSEALSVTARIKANLVP